ncbi:hypothetical protein FFT87_12835 [Salinibacterium sp. M195]|nr:hypothetical protein FFT87_12835 [Salinibacterium sp. M195]
MEFASYLAGEKWSDHPACTHPALALLARLVNDCTSDRDRPQLAELIPSVIGVTSADPRLELHIALRAATMALPVASEGRQQALAVGILATQAQLAEIEPFTGSPLADEVASAFAQAPAAERWATKFSADYGVDRRGRAVKRMTESIIGTAVIGIAEACTPGASQRMRALLRDAIEDCRAIVESNANLMAEASPPRGAALSPIR